MKAVVDDAISRYGRLDVMFANAGITGGYATFRDLEKEDMMEVLRVNTLGCVDALLIFHITDTLNCESNNTCHTAPS